MDQGGAQGAEKWMHFIKGLRGEAKGTHSRVGYEWALRQGVEAGRPQSLVNGGSQWWEAPFEVGEHQEPGTTMFKFQKA